MPKADGQFQHYISQFLLKNFKDIRQRPSRKIWRYNLITKKCTLESISNLAGISNAWDSDFEKEFSAIESKASKLIREIIKQIRNKKSVRDSGISLEFREHDTLFDYVAWLMELQPSSINFALNPNQATKIPDKNLLRKQQRPFFEFLLETFHKPYFRRTTGKNPFVLPDCYIIPVIGSEYIEGEDPWAAVSHIYFPLAYDTCLVWNHKRLSEENIKEFGEKISTDDINRTAAVFAQENSEDQCLYGINKESLERTVKIFRQKGGGLGWKNAD